MGVAGREMGPPLWADDFTLKMVNTAVQYPSQTLSVLLALLAPPGVSPAPLPPLPPRSEQWSMQPPTNGQAGRKALTGERQNAVEAVMNTVSGKVCHQ